MFVLIVLINMLLPPFSNSWVSLWVSEFFKTEEKLLPADLKVAQIYIVAGAYEHTVGFFLQFTLGENVLF